MTVKTKEVFKPEVAKAIADFIVTKKYDGDMTDDNARALLVAAHRIGDEVFEVGGKYAVLKDVPNARIMGAMIRGYVSEKTPNEKVSEFYRCGETTTQDAATIRTTLNLLGIKISGVNA